MIMIPKYQGYTTQNDKLKAATATSNVMLIQRNVTLYIEHRKTTRRKASLLQSTMGSPAGHKKKNAIIFERKMTEFEYKNYYYTIL